MDRAPQPTGALFVIPDDGTKKLVINSGNEFTAGVHVDGTLVVGDQIDARNVFIEDLFAQNVRLSGGAHPGLTIATGDTTTPINKPYNIMLITGDDVITQSFFNVPGPTYPNPPHSPALQSQISLLQMQKDVAALKQKAGL